MSTTLMASTSAPRLVVHQGAGGSRSVAIDQPRLTIGRSEQAGLPFADTKLSREHAEIAFSDGAWRVRDLDSRNGTFLNGRKLGADAVPLTAGDRIALGLVELEFVPAAAPATTSNAPSAAPSGPGVAGTHLHVVSGALAGRDLALGERSVLGRSAADADCSLEDSAASRRNTEISAEGARWMIRDLGSRNGTEVDGERLPAETAVRLHAGARLRVGATILEFRDHRVDGREGHQLQGWTLGTRLGAGAAGVVYRARSESGGDGALKLLDPGLAADPREAPRFINAARAQARVSHPNVARVLLAEIVAGQPLVVSELAGQGSLATALAAGQPLPAERVLPWLRDAARGLQAAAERDLAHRGLRPGNLLLDEEGGVVVADLGTCAGYDRTQPQAGPATNWLSPEEADGADPDALANQFSLGCIAWQALTGVLPFASGERATTARARQTLTLPTPAVAPSLIAVLARLLARAPGDRYPGWAEAAADLDALVRGAEPAAAPGTFASALAVPPPPAPPVAVRASARMAAPESSVEMPIAPVRRERVTLPPIAVKGLIALGIVILFAGFILPALNRSAPVGDAPQRTAEVATTPVIAAKRVESPSEMIARIEAEENQRKLERFAEATGTTAPAAPTPTPAPSAAPVAVAQPVLPPVEPATPSAPAVLPAEVAAVTAPAGAAQVAPARNPDAQTGDARFRSRRYAEAVTAYRAALTRNPDHPYLVARLAEAERLQTVIVTAQTQVPAAILAADHDLVLAQIAAYIDAAGPLRLEPAWQQGLLAAWTARAGEATPEQRARLQAAAKSAGVTLAYDEQAPALLAQAVDAARAGADAKQQVALFAKAAKAKAGFGDDENLLYASALVAANQRAAAAERIALLSTAARAKPEAQALALSLGLQPPTLEPQVVAQFVVGGDGDQYIRDVGFEGAVAWAKGTGFTVLVDTRSGKTSIQGDPATVDAEEWAAKFTRSPKASVELKDPRNGQTYSWTTLQVHPVLQQPLLSSSAGWKLWGWNNQQVAEGTKGVRWGPLMADSRIYDTWLMPEGRIGVLCWTDGGNSVLTRDPRDLQKANDAIEQGGSFRTGAGGMATMFMLIDAKTGTPLSGTFLRSHVTNRVVDAFGRVYLPKPMEGATPLGGATAEAGGGLFVLRPDLRQPELNIRLGAGNVTGGKEAFGVLALHDNLLILGGTSNNPALPGPGGSKHGGGQNGFVCVLRLWEKR